MKSAFSECPYPESMFAPLTSDERERILTAIRATGIRSATDRLFSEWGRSVWSACTTSAGGEMQALRDQNEKLKDELRSLREQQHGDTEGAQVGGV